MTVAGFQPDPTTQPERLTEYLRRTNWMIRDTDERSSLWFTADTDDFQIVVPSRVTADYAQQFEDALRVLSHIEKRSLSDVRSDVASGGADTVSVRLHPDTPSGEAPLDYADIAVGAMRDYVLGSSSGVETNQLVLPARRPARAVSYLKRVRLSTAKGSFILRIALPLEDDLELVVEQSSNTPALLSVPQSPFGRSVTTRMRKVTERAMELADQVGKGDQGIASFGRFDTNTPNATELEALAALGTGDAERKRYELIFAQSPLSEISRTSGVKKLTVTPSQQAVFADAAEYLRTKQPRSEVTVSGLVVSLSKEGASGVGSATILGLDDDSGRPHRVQLELPPADYEKAIGAHKDGLKVQAKGDLQINGTKRSLSPLRGFDVQEGLHEPDLFSPWPV